MNEEAPLNPTKRPKFGPSPSFKQVQAHCGVFQTPPIEVELECGGFDGGGLDTGPIEVPADAGRADSSALEELVSDPGCGCGTSQRNDRPGGGWGSGAILVWALLRRRHRRR